MRWALLLAVLSTGCKSDTEILLERSGYYESEEYREEQRLRGR